MIKKLSKPILSAFLFMLFISIEPALGQKVYQVYQVDTITDADLKVHVVTDTALADMYVRVVDSAKYVNKDGLWYFTPVDSLARLKIYMLPDTAGADLNIYYVTDKKKAGWIKKTKKPNFKKKLYAIKEKEQGEIEN